MRPARRDPYALAGAGQSASPTAITLKVLRRTSMIMNESVMREAAHGLDRVTRFQGENAI